MCVYRELYFLSFFFGDKGMFTTINKLLLLYVYYDYYVYLHFVRV